MSVYFSIILTEFPKTQKSYVYRTTLGKENWE